MKRILVLSLALVLAVSVLTGCSAPKPQEQPPGQPPQPGAGAQLPAAAKTYNDGTYTAAADADDHGYALATVTIKDDKITAVQLKEVTEKAVDKDFNTYPYAPSKEANAEMAKRFVEKNSVDVDNYTKATHSSEKYKQAVNRALEKAKVTPAVTTTYFDGTFMGRSKAGEHGYAIALVTIKGDKVTEVKLNEVTEKNEFKDYAKYPYKKSVEAHEQLPAKFVETNGRPVDTFTGATHSTAAFNAAVTSALELAKVK
ncbi:MAG TPA: FMN-binding protein [Firmicutes bacterium]|nr:FMN-binding protein [Bacillota bacterium]